MLMELELKHIVGYLPYGLKMAGCQSELNCGILQKWLDGEWDITPLLLPLSALTEPLPDGSIPIVELAKMCYSKLNWDVMLKDGKCYVGSKFNPEQYTFWYSLYEDSFYCISTYRSEPKAVPYQNILFEYMYSIHADINKLIEAGLAINKKDMK